MLPENIVAARSNQELGMKVVIVDCSIKKSAKQ